MPQHIIRKVGIVGAEAAKFTPETEAQAREIIRAILLNPLYPLHGGTRAELMVSGGCHLGGIDIWAEEEAGFYRIPKLIHYPKKLQWSGGYEQRNLLIARDSDIVHCIVVRSLPPGFKGMRFPTCYHCKEARAPHVKSGGCWTALRAKLARWHLVGTYSNSLLA